jgi:hypothetical protein
MNVYFPRRAGKLEPGAQGRIEVSGYSGWECLARWHAGSAVANASDEGDESATMTKRLAITPAIGLFAGLSVVSYGAANMLLNGVHGTSRATTNTCSSAAPASPAPTASTGGTSPLMFPRTRPVSHISGGARHPASMPVLLAAVRFASAQTTPSPPSTQPSQSPSPPVLPQPSPAASAAPTTAQPQPAPAQSTSSTQQINPGGTLKSPIATPTPTPTSTSTPTPTSTATSTPTPTSTSTTPPPGTLCLRVQTLDNVRSVDPHTTVRYAIWVSLSGTSGTAKVTLSASPSSVSPTFSVCPSSGGSSCKIGLSAGQNVQLRAKLKAPGRSHHHVTLTAKATSAQASKSASASATVDINRASAGGNSSSSSQNAGDGTTFPFSPLSPASLPSGTVVPGVGIQPTGDLGSAFPQVSPSPSASGAAAASHGRSTKAINLSAGLPLNMRLIGGQIIGLAALAAAVTIAVARLSLRRQPQAPDGDGPDKS